MKITLIRHTSVAVPPGVCYGQTDVEVAPCFAEEAAAVRKSIAGETFDAVFSSPLSRCRQLAAYCGFPTPVLDDRLKELNFGHWEMQKWDDITDPSLTLWYNDWIHLPAGGAESYADQCARVAAFLDELRHSNYANPCIFTHRGVIACALVYAGLCSAKDSFNEDIPYGSKTDIFINRAGAER